MPGQHAKGVGVTTPYCLGAHAEARLRLGGAPVVKISDLNPPGKISKKAPMTRGGTLNIGGGRGFKLRL